MFFILKKTEVSFLNGSVISTKCCPSPISSGELGITLLFKLSCPEQKTLYKMKNDYDYDYSGGNDEESSDEEEAAVIGIDQSKPVSYAAYQPKLQPWNF